MNAKPQQPVREIMTVTRTERVTPHYIRIYLTGPSATISNIANMTVGVNNKILVPRKGTNHVDLNNKATFTMRTYTHRGVDIEKQEIWIDFVSHAAPQGGEAPAADWAMHAQSGDKLGVMMKPKSRLLYPPVGDYLLVGDATAIPVLGAILESLPKAAKGQCIIEVHGKADEQVLANPAGLPITWLYNAHPEQGSQIVDAVKKLDLPTDSRFAYIACEYRSVRAIRHYLATEQGWAKNELFASSYWKAGMAEDASAADRRAEKGGSLLNAASALLRGLSTLGKRSLSGQ